jgi:hypothetical protein
MTKMQFEIFVALWENGDWMTRKQLKGIIRHPKGYAKAIGTGTKGKPQPASLEGRGFVETRRTGGAGGQLEHRVTPIGKSAIRSW